MHHPRLEELVRQRQRYPIEAYEMVREAIAHANAVNGAGADGDVSGAQLLEALRDLARSEFGQLAACVFHLWGVHRTDDVGEIVFDLAGLGLIDMAPHDAREQFASAFDLAGALSASLPIDIPSDDEMAP